jgi:hypothetical protein
MKLIHASKLTAEDLSNRNMLCYLPTEMVISRPENIEKFLKRVYFYRLPDKNFPRKYEEGKFSNGSKYKTWHNQIAIEWYYDHGSDGHTEYYIQKEYIVMYENEIDLSKFDFDSYQKLKEIAYDILTEKRKIEEQQLTFNNFYGRWSWGYHHTWS